MKSLEELRKIKEQVKKGMQMREGGQKIKIVVGMGTCGIAAGARETMKAFMEALEKAGVTDAAVTATGCAGYCEQEPLVDIEILDQKSVRYGKVDRAAAERIVKEHLVGGRVVSDLVFS